MQLNSIRKAAHGVRFVSKSYLRLFACVVIACVSIETSGCYQRTIAPELEYEQSEVDALEKEIDKLEFQ